MKTLRLRGLDPAAHYELTDFDVAGTRQVSGTVLIDEGLVLETRGQPAAALIAYRRLGQNTQISHE